MRLFNLFLLAVVLGQSLRAADQLINVTSQTLEDWSVVGVDKAVLSQEPRLVLPAGVELSRKFASQATVVRLLSRPVFSTGPAEWPILEVGPAAAALISKDGEGRIVLVVDENTVVDLPWRIPNGTDDVGIELVLAYDPVTGSGLIGLGDKFRSFDATPSARPVGVVLSAGDHASWPQDLMEVHLLADVASGHRVACTKDSSTGKFQEEVKAALKPAGAGGNRDEGPTAARNIGSASKAASHEGSFSGLEVFTPPSVRCGRAGTVRSLVAKSQNK